MMPSTQHLFSFLPHKYPAFWTCLLMTLMINGLLFSSIVQAQPIPNGWLCNPESIACLADESQNIWTVPGWEVYQTINNTWNGERDTTNCLSYAYEEGWCGIRVQMADINPDKSLFVRCQLDEDNKVPLQADLIYGLVYYEEGVPIFGSGDITFNQNDTCANNLCSGVRLEVQIPNESGDGFETRDYTSTLQDSPWGEEIVANLCFPTERFEGENFLREVVFKFTITDFNPDSYLELQGVDLYESWETVPHETWYADWYNPTTQHYVISPDPFYRHLLKYTETSYPQAGNPSYVDVFPYETTGNVDTIDLVLDFETTLIAQPFTFLRGGLVDEAGSVRHQFNLIQEGGDFCLPTIIEVLFENGNQYIYESGKLDLTGTNSCMQFGKGSSLNVAEGATLEYGKYGQGILMLRSGGGIEIGQDAELIVGNKLMMQEYANDVPQQIYMTLNQGSRLTFTETARISNEYSINQAMRLNVYMKGGILDDSALDAPSRALINRIYDTSADERANNLVIYQNPILSGTALQWSSIFDQNETTQAQLFDITGRLIYQNRMETQQGINYFTLPTNDLQSGTYFLSVLVDGEMETKKVVIYQ